MSQVDTNVDRTTNQPEQVPVKKAKDPVRKWTFITLIIALNISLVISPIDASIAAPVTVPVIASFRRFDFG